MVNLHRLTLRNREMTFSWLKRRKMNLKAKVDSC